jgi:hypothetical protein
VTFTVDIHHHMRPDFFWRATNEGDHPVGGIAPPPWSRASALARRCNELATELTQARPLDVLIAGVPSLLRQAVGEDDLDNRRDGLQASPVALKFAGE